MMVVSRILHAHTYTARTYIAEGEPTLVQSCTYKSYACAGQSIVTQSCSLQVERLPVFWKQQRLMFFDAFSFAFPAALQRIPYSLLVSLIWTVITYFPVGLAPQPSRLVCSNWSRVLCCAVLNLLLSGLCEFPEFFD